MARLTYMHQSTNESCGVCCVMMVLEYFRKDETGMGKAKRDRYEAQLYRRFRLKEDEGRISAEQAKGTLGAAVAFALAERGLDVTLWHETENLLENRDGYYPEEMHAAMLEQHRAYIAKEGGRFPCRAGVVIDAALLRAELEKGKLLIVQFLIPGDADGMHDHVLHWVIIHGTDGDDFRVCDPLRGKSTIGQAELEEYMKTPVGSSMISAGKRT